MPLSVSQKIISTINEVTARKDKSLPLHEPEFNGNEWAYVKDCLDSGWVSSVGAYVDRFEDDLARQCGVAHAICVVNGTAALHICLHLLGVRKGDEVLIPALTFVATANAVHYTGATPHFVDSTETNLGIDAEKLGQYLSEIAELRDGKCYNKKTDCRIAALIPMHVFGHASSITQLLALSEKWGIPLIEDAAEALGSTFHGKPLGSFGTLSALSFNGNKIMTTGGGGAILTNNSEFAKRAKHLTTTAKAPHRFEFIHDEIGYNYRMPNINAALGCAQLEQLPGIIEKKRALASAYKIAFQNLNGVSFFEEPKDCNSNYWLNTLLLDVKYDKNQVLRECHDAGILARPAWKLLKDLDIYSKSPSMDVAISRHLSNVILNIPSSSSIIKN